VILVTVANFANGDLEAD